MTRAAALPACLSLLFAVCGGAADGTTGLHQAVEHDDLEGADRLLKQGADAKAANRYGITPLFLACQNGSAAMISKLLAAGADPNSPGPEGETPLMTVARTGNVAAAKVLLDHKADVNARESWRGQTALMWAVAEQRPAMVQELIAHGADVNARSTIEHWARQHTAEPRPKEMPLGGLTPLLFAARQGDVESAKLLLAARAAVNLASPEGVTPLLLALLNGHFDTAAVLLDKGADPNLGDQFGRTPLYAAVELHTPPSSERPTPKEEQHSSMDLIRALLAKGAYVNATLKAQAPYRSRLDRGSDVMLAAGTTPLLRAAKAGDVEVMQVLLEKGADVNLATVTGITPLMAAAGLGAKEEDTVGRQKTEKDAIAAIQLCLKAGASIRATDRRGRTALHAAAQRGKNEIIEFLVAHGALLDAKDRSGLTPLDLARGRGDLVNTVHSPATIALLRRLAVQ